MTPVESSNIAAVGYANGTLTIQFKNGAKWDYDAVPAEVHADMMAAESVGKFFAANIRGKFTSTKQDAPSEESKNDE